MNAEEQNREQVPDADSRAGAGSDAGAGAGGRGSAEGEMPGGPGEERMRILRMLSERKISAEEAEELLAAVEPPKEDSPTSAFLPRSVLPPFQYANLPRSGGMFGPRGLMGPPGSGFMGRWEPPDRPGSPAPPPPPPGAATIMVPRPRWTTKSREKSDLSLAFEVKDGGKEMNAALPLSLARATEQFLPRHIRQYLKRYEVNLGQLLEVAEATDDEAIGVDGLELFHVKEGQVVLTVTLQRAL